MKYILISALFFLYTICSSGILGFAILFPLAAEMLDWPWWAIVILYFFVIVIASTQRHCSNYFQKNLDF